METQIKEHQASYYKIINAERQCQDENSVECIGITEASRVLVTEEMNKDHLRIQH